MAKLPLVSVIITYHDEGDNLLHRAIASIERQTYSGPIEIIVVDDASKKTPSLPSSCRYSISLVRSDVNLGLPSARNLGVSVSKGEFVSFLDADDIYLSKRIEGAVSCFLKYSEVVLVGCGGIIKRFKKTWRHYPPLIKEIYSSKELYSVKILPLIASKYICFTYPFHSCGFTIKRCAFDDVGGFNPRYHWGEEWDIQIRLAQVGRIAYFPDPGYKYIMRISSITQTINPLKHVSYAELMINAMKYLDRNFLPKKLYMKKRASEEFLLAAQIYFEHLQNVDRAIYYAMKSFFLKPSLWGFRSFVRYCLYKLIGRDFSFLFLKLKNK